MSDEEAIKTVATVITSPIWVPVTAVGGLVCGAAVGLVAANDIGKDIGPLAGIAAAPFIVGASILISPFLAIKHVADVMIGNNDKKK